MEDDTERREQAMDVQDVIAQARDTLTSRGLRAIRKDGVAVLPRPGSGGAGGNGQDTQGRASDRERLGRPPERRASLFATAI